MTYQQLSESYNLTVKEWNKLTPQRQQSHEGYKLLERMKGISKKLTAFDKARCRAVGNYHN